MTKPRPMLSPEGCVLRGNHQGNFQLRNRGRGVARNVRLTLADSATVVVVREVEPGRRLSTPDGDFSDATVFREPLNVPVKIRITFSDRYSNEHVVTLPIRQDPRNDGRFNIAPAWGEHEHTAPTLTAKELRRIGDA